MDTTLWKTLKIMGDQIIEKTYEGQTENTINRYKKHFVKVVHENRKSMLASYNTAIGIITIYTLSEHINTELMITYLHELSHHIETVLSGSTTHGETFYQIHISLIISAIELKFLTYEEILSLNSSAQNNQKLKRIIRKRCKC